MAHKRINVPIIAITPEAEEDDDHNYSTLADALTDVETLEFDDNKRRESEKSRPKLMIKLTGDRGGAVTDTEDVEASGDEVEVRLVPYDKPVSIDDLDLDPGECKETHKIRSRNSQGRKKLHTQSSTVTESNAQLGLDDLSVTEGTTDVEECVASDEDPSDVAESMVPDYLLEAAITTQISDKLCISAPADVDADLKRLTDVEKLDSNSEDERKVIHRRRVKRRKQKVESARTHGERHDSDDSDASEYNIKFGQSLPMPQPAEEGLTDVEMLDSNDDNHPVEIPVAIIRRCRRGNSTDEEILSDPDASYHIRPIPEPPLPKPYRKLITVRDTQDRPIVTITPIDDTYRSEFRLDYCGDTDEEFLSDTDALLFAEALSRGPTPELSIFEGGFDDVTESVRLRRRRSLKPVSPTILEELTDTEDYVVGGVNRRYLSSLTVSRGDPFTDTEDMFLSDCDSRRRNSGTDLESILMSDDEYLNEKVDLLRALSTTPVSMRELGGDTIVSKEGNGPFSGNSRLSVDRRVSIVRDYVSPIPTDCEDFYVSDADEAPQEVMYLRGGSFRDVCTDTEDGNASDDEHHACLNKKKFSVDILSDNNVLVSMKKMCANLKDCPGPFSSKIGKGKIQKVDASCRLELNRVEALKAKIYTTEFVVNINAECTKYVTVLYWEIPFNVTVPFVENLFYLVGNTTLIHDQPVSRRELGILGDGAVGHTGFVAKLMEKFERRRRYSIQAHKTPDNAVYGEYRCKGEVAPALPEPTRTRQPAPFRDVGDEGDTEVPTQGPSSHSSQRLVADQHQLSEEMKQLLRDMEEETKK